MFKNKPYNKYVTYKRKRKMQSLLSNIENQFNASMADVVSKICDDYKLPFEEVKTKYLANLTHPPISPPKKTRAKKTVASDRPFCPCFSRSGASCKNRCIEGQDACKTHFGKKPEETGKIIKEKKQRTNKSKKSKKVDAQPLHNHDPNSSSANCEVCKSHGNILTEETYDEDSVSLHARLSKTTPIPIKSPQKTQTVLEKITDSTAASPSTVEKGLSMLDHLIDDDDEESAFKKTTNDEDEEEEAGDYNQEEEEETEYTQEDEEAFMY